MYFDLKGCDGCCHVVRHGEGVLVDHEYFDLVEMHDEEEGFKVMCKGLHIYWVSFKLRGIATGPDFREWKTVDFEDWRKGYDGKTPRYMRIEGKLFQVEGLDRHWPCPKILQDGIVVGHIEGETDMEGTTTYNVKWL